MVINVIQETTIMVSWEIGKSYAGTAEPGGLGALAPHFWGGWHFFLFLF